MWDMDRFWSKVDKSGDCWVWTAAVSSKGYGRFKLNGKLVSPHRLAWEWANGPIPDGLVVCHECDNPPCVNPAHLKLGTQSQNMLDCVSRGRNYTNESRYCKRGHDKDALPRGDHGRCRACQRQHNKEYMRRWRNGGKIGVDHP